MLAHIENELKRSGNNGLAQVVLGVRNTLGKDIPFPISESVLSLEEAKAKYIENPFNSEYLTQLMRSFWTENDVKNNETTVVPEFPLKSEEIKERAKQNQMAVFNGDDWMWIEKLDDAPNLNTNVVQLRKKFEKDGREVMDIKTYKTGGKIHKVLYGKYFDEGGTFSIVLDNLRYFVVGFRSDGILTGDSHPNPWFCNEHLGCRFEEVIKA